MNPRELKAAALDLLEGFSTSCYLEDAREHAPTGHCVAGAFLALIHDVDREIAELAVREALLDLYPGTFDPLG
jgi:hypothetical protein